MASPTSGTKTVSGTIADLARCAIFHDLEDAQKQRLLDQHRVIRVPAGQPLLHEQDDGQVLFVFRSGIAKVRSIDVEGQEVVLSLMGPGDLCGEMAILHGGRRTADVVCLTDCEVLMLRALPFRDLLHGDARLAIALARLESQRLQRLNRRFLRRESRAMVRMLEVLADLACRTALEAPATAPIPALPQRELAALSGLARETASRTLTRLRKQGLVEPLPAGALRLVVPAGKGLDNLAAWVAPATGS
jgi:CRP-like cAMP-binding protein